jgi:hypothetical protein
MEGATLQLIVSDELCLLIIFCLLLSSRPRLSVS